MICVTSKPASSAPAVTIRLLAADDWAELRAARLAALAEAPYAFGSTLTREQEFTEETWRSRAGRGTTFGAWRGATIVGLATGMPPEPGRPEWHLVGMWVSPDVRGQGVAESLVEAVCGQAGRAGVDAITLWVTEVNGRARTFYRRRGFASTGRRQLVRPEEPDHWEEELARRLR